jgi:uncharacterized membrane protein YdjX (TVP38/TMEM64 family)
MNENRMEKLLEVLQSRKGFQIAITAILLFVMIIISLSIDINEVQLFLKNHQRQAFFIGILIYFILGFTFLPTAPLTLFNAIILGPFEAVGIAVTGNMISAMVGYQLGKTMVIPKNVDTFKDSLPEWVRKYTVSSPVFLIVGRLLPIGRLPLSYVCGAFRVPVIRYCWSSLLIYIITASFLSFVSYNLGQLF